MQRSIHIFNNAFPLKLPLWLTTNRRHDYTDIIVLCNLETHECSNPIVDYLCLFFIFEIRFSDSPFFQRWPWPVRWQKNVRGCCMTAAWLQTTSLLFSLSRSGDLLVYDWANKTSWSFKIVQNKVAGFALHPWLSANVWELAGFSLPASTKKGENKIFQAVSQFSLETFVLSKISYINNRRSHSTWQVTQGYVVVPSPGGCAMQRTVLNRATTQWNMLPGSWTKAASKADSKKWFCVHL